MSAQGGTLARRGAVHLPIWPVAILLAAAIAGAIALSTLGRDVAPAVVDQGTLPATQAVVEEITFPRGLEHAGAYPGSVSSTVPVGLENPSAYGISQVTEAGTYQVGLENPGAYPADETFTPKADGHRPIVVNGEICGQCL
jgi:hypothetical protein